VAAAEEEEEEEEDSGGGSPSMMASGMIRTKLEQKAPESEPKYGSKIQIQEAKTADA
jgi:hypothetical protein